MARKFVRTQIAGHAYETVPYSFREHWDLKLILAEILAKPLGDTAGKALVSLLSGGDFEVDEIAEKLGPLTDRLGDVLAGIPAAIRHHGSADLLIRLLKTTTVEVQEDGGTRRRLRLAEESSLDHLYTGGPGQVECLEALAWVLAVNYSPFGTDGWPGWEQLWDRLSDYLPAPQMPTEETTQTNENKPAAANG